MGIAVLRITGLVFFFIVFAVFLHRAFYSEDSRTIKKAWIASSLSAICMILLGNGWSPSLFMLIIPIVALIISLHRET